MAKSVVFRRGGGSSGEVSFNLTPLIDCTFQLIVFFVLTSQLASQQLAKVDLPSPLEGQIQTKQELDVNKVIVTVVSAEGSGVSEATPGRAKEYQIDGGGIAIGDEAKLEELIRRKKAGAGGEDFFVEIRGDWRVNYASVEPIMLAAAKAGIAKMNITVKLESGKAGAK